MKFTCALRHALGEKPVAALNATRNDAEDADPPVPKLSARQTEILHSITRGLSDKDIARQLGISVPMVKEHVNATFEKLGAANRAEAVAIAMRKHLLKM